ncbi:inactive serine/threonine-protein kinase TEX14-like [Dermochelys coriacea]|uniref:inactive serine/threonine-protein kinase TEX14-like n=1 Tax=Dermochelys coriacea TaxID=27794 RepID=UPI001CA9B640|nr:inactive serine/threonine-protein kinase TEX14-like [Dermochelys coriacea]
MSGGHRLWARWLPPRLLLSGVTPPCQASAARLPSGQPGLALPEAHDAGGSGCTAQPWQQGLAQASGPGRRVPAAGGGRPAARPGPARPGNDPPPGVLPHIPVQGGGRRQRLQRERERGPCRLSAPFPRSSRRDSRWAPPPAALSANHSAGGPATCAGHRHRPFPRACAVAAARASLLLPRSFLGVLLQRPSRAMPKPPVLPPCCPTSLGSVAEPGSLAGQLHQHVTEGRLRKTKKLLKRGVDVDGQNTAGQTGLFVAALLGHTMVARLFLRFRADPNHRCYDGSTPVHAAAFSCQRPLFAQVLEAGGDLRLHDQQGRTPQDWAEQAGSDQNAEVLAFIQQCRARMVGLTLHREQGATQTLSSRVEDSPRSLRSSLSSLLSAFFWSLDSSGTDWSGRGPVVGFGQLCPSGPLRPSFASVTPIADPDELLRAQAEPDLSYENGPYTLMSNCLWKGQFVTVRWLKPEPPGSRPHGPTDLLVAEQQHCSCLHHPQLLLLLAVSPSLDLCEVRLVFERVEMGSLYWALHQEAPCPPAPPSCLAALRLLLQLCEALLFLHGQGYVHRALTSHAIQLVRPGLAKLSSLEYMRPRAETGPRDPAPPPELYNWLPPEVIRDRPASTTSDLYSFCAVTQEIFTGAVPWYGAEGVAVQQWVQAGRALAPAACVPPPCYEVVRAGLAFRERERYGSLPDIRYILRKALQEATGRPVGPLSLSPRRLCTWAGEAWTPLECLPAGESHRVRMGWTGCTVSRPSPPPLCSPEVGDGSPERAAADGNAGRWAEPGRGSPVPGLQGKGQSSPQVCQAREASDSSLEVDSSSQEETRGWERGSPGSSTAEPARSPALPCVSSLQASACLLDQAQASLETLERRFASGIQALQDLVSLQGVLPARPRCGRRGAGQTGPRACCSLGALQGSGRPPMAPVGEHSGGPRGCPLQTLIDFSAWVRMQEQQQGLGCSDPAREPALDSPFGTLQSLDLLQEIIDELKGTGDAAVRQLASREQSRPRGCWKCMKTLGHDPSSSQICSGVQEGETLSHKD